MQIPNRLVDPNRHLMMVQPFIHRINFASLAAAATATGSFTTQNDSDFVITKTTYFCFQDVAVFNDTAIAAMGGLTANKRILPPVTCQLNDSGSGRNLLEAGIPISTLFGDAQLPYIWSEPYKLSGNSTMTATLENLSTAAGGNQAFVIRLQFHGVKLFYGGVK